MPPKLGTTTKAESAQALICSLADLLGSKKFDKFFDGSDIQSKVATYAELKKKVGAEKLKKAYNRIRIGGIAQSLLEKFLPERQIYSDIFNATKAFLNFLVINDEVDNKQWIKGYVKWEIGLLSSIGFSLDLKQCAVTGQKNDLYYVSPKTGKAVSKKGAGKFAPKLLKLPIFLGGAEDNRSSFNEEIIMGLNITTYFFKNKLLLSINDSRIMNLPNPRDRLENMIKKL